MQSVYTRQRYIASSDGAYVSVAHKLGNATLRAARRLRQRGAYEISLYKATLHCWQRWRIRQRGAYAVSLYYKQRYIASSDVNFIYSKTIYAPGINSLHGNIQSTSNRLI